MAIDRRATRLGVLALVGVMLFSLLGVRLWFLQTVKAEELQAVTTASKTRTVKIPPERGRIFDADGRILADNQRILTVAVDWQQLRRKTDRQEIFRRLSAWVEVPVEDMEARFQSGVDSPFLPMPIKRGVDEPTAIALAERIEDFPGLQIVPEWRRVYPYAPHAAHVIGYMGAITAEQADEYEAAGYLLNERVGQFGVELSMERVLHGTWGERVYEVDAANRPVRLLRDVPPINGFDVQLTIDLDIQQYAEQAVESTLEARRTQKAPNPNVKKPDGTIEPMDLNSPEEVPYKAPAGSAVVMDYTDGSVIAMASYPTFDNRWFEAGISGRKFNEIFPSTNADGSPIDPDRAILVNRAIQGRYNLGSTFKPIVAFAALDTGLIDRNFVHEDNGFYQLTWGVDPAKCKSGLIRCEYRNAICGGTGRPCVYGEVDVEDALAVSSDTFFYRIGEKIMERNDGRPVLQDEIRKFQFGSDTGIELPYEFDGTVPDRTLKAKYAELGVISEDEGGGYFVGDNVQLAIGQGLLSATPLQLSVAYGALANQGFVYQPKVIKAIYDPGVPDGLGPDGESGYADLEAGTVFEQRDRPVLLRQLRMPAEVHEPIVRGLTRVICPEGGGCGVGPFSTTGEKLFANYPAEAIPLAGKTGTAQGANNYPWNDSSAFSAFSLDPSQPYVVTAYLEKSGYGSQAAAPVVKCTFLVLSGIKEADPVELSDPLDLDATTAAPSQSLRDTSCWIGRNGLNGVLTQDRSVD
jgi:penicillin-binding protein 2